MLRSRSGPESSWHPKGVVSLIHEIAQDFGLERATDRVTLTIITDHGTLEVTEVGDGSDHSTIRLKDVAGDVHLIQEQQDQVASIEQLKTSNANLKNAIEEIKASNANLKYSIHQHS